GEIEMMPQGVLDFAAWLRLKELEVPGRRGVVSQRALVAPALDAGELQGQASLNAVQIVDGRRGGRQCLRKVFDFGKGRFVPALANHFQRMEARRRNRTSCTGKAPEH